MPVRNLVFQGGGVKGIAYVGVLGALEQAGILATVQRVAGTSAGAITAALVACGATASDVSDALTHTSFKSFADGAGGAIGDAVRLGEQGFGIHPGATIEQWLQDRIGQLTQRALGTASPSLTLAQLHALATTRGAPFRELYAISTNLTSQRAEVLSAATMPDLEVWRAVRMSMSIPIFFASVSYANAWWADGAVSWNFPVDLFDGVQKQPVGGPQLPAASAPDETLGFCLGTNTEISAMQASWGLPPVEVKDFRTYMSSLVAFLLDEPTLLHLDDADLARAVFIDSADVHTTQFDLTPEQAQTLVANGRDATMKFLAAHPDLGSPAVAAPPNALLRQDAPATR